MYHRGPDLLSNGSVSTFDQKETHDQMLEEGDQTWYFVLADCDGNLEVFKDTQTKREHLLGLYDFMHDPEEEQPDPQDIGEHLSRKR
mmetsp:Transcript_24215/g.37309  ORF Transcript_24215/g.37309 Transcript_24215/m.37309 type:complete len:87 (-) Transcript_24215:1271-1531(-)